MRTTNVVDVLDEVVRYHHVVLQRRINFVSSRMALHCTNVEDSFFDEIGIQATLKSLLSPPPLCKWCSHIRIDQFGEQVKSL